MLFSKKTYGIFALFGFALNFNAAVLFVLLHSYLSLLYITLSFLCYEYVTQNFMNEGEQDADTGPDSESK